MLEMINWLLGLFFELLVWMVAGRNYPMGNWLFIEREIMQELRDYRETKITLKFLSNLSLFLFSYINESVSGGETNRARGVNFLVSVWGWEDFRRLLVSIGRVESHKSRRGEVGSNCLFLGLIRLVWDRCQRMHWLADGGLVPKGTYALPSWLLPSRKPMGNGSGCCCFNSIWFTSGTEFGSPMDHIRKSRLMSRWPGFSRLYQLIIGPSGQRSKPILWDHQVDYFWKSDYGLWGIDVDVYKATRRLKDSSGIAVRTTGDGGMMGWDLFTKKFWKAVS
ncbi:hypothetical protein L1987_20385 [Smallanthus sonchifolius]|uniref:Uncharacterized protein n=1 Tax=Smallanthus sonchifolius TaxID=185202 RepID=A0ACB9ISW4_9ASTR|nr:hypothetical protein L1987_20385 [Smallanthus sonchifolius]